MLPIRPQFLFVAQSFQNLDKPYPRFTRRNYRIDVTARSCEIRVVKLFSIVLDQFFPPSLRIGSFLNLAAEDDIGRAFGTDDSNLSSRPCQGYVRAKMT